jgi:hypothetical protein
MKGRTAEATLFLIVGIFALLFIIGAIWAFLHLPEFLGFVGSGL